MSRARTELSPALGFLQRLWELNHTLERLSSQMEKSLGVTAQQRLILRCVGEFPDSAAGQLATILRVDAGTMSAAVRRLLAKQLLRRTVDKTDKRRSTLALTKDGARLARLVTGTVEGAVMRLIDGHEARAITTCKTVIGELAAELARSSATLAKNRQARGTKTRAPRI